MDPIPSDEELTPIPADSELVPADDELTHISAEPAAIAAPATDDVELAPLLTKKQFADKQRIDADPFFNPYAGQQAQHQAEEAAKDDLVRSGFKAVSEPGLSPELQDLKLAQHFNIPLGYVKVNRQAWADQYAKVNGDPKAWREQYPLSARLVLDHPELVDHVVSNKELNVLLQGWNKVVDFVADVTDNPQVQDVAALLTGGAYGQLDNDKAWAERQQLLAAGEPIPPELAAPTFEERQAQFAADQAAAPEARAKRDAPKQVEEVDNAEAARIRSQGALAITQQRAKESKASLEVSGLYHQLMVARGTGGDTTDLESRIYEAEQAATPLALGETGATQALAESWGTAQSTIGVLKNVVDRGGTGAALGGVAGAVVGAAVTKTPLGAWAGALKGAAIGGKFGAGYGAAEGSFILESGDSYSQLLKTKTDTGELLTEQEARGGAIIAATIKTGIELAELGAIAKALGPAAGLIEKGGLDTVKAMLATNPGFRALAVNAAKAWIGEGLEEVSQEATDELVNYAVRTKHDNPEAAQGIVDAAVTGNFPAAAAALVAVQPEKGPVLDPEALKENLVMGLMGGALFGTGGLVVASSTHAIAQSKQERGALQVPELAKIAAEPSAQAMAKDVAKLITEKTSETGDDVTHVYVDPSGFRRLFQDQQQADQKATELLGEDGPKKLAEAEAAGGKIEVPLEQYIAKWGKDGVAEQLTDDTATQLGHSTPRQLKEQAQANEKWAQEIAAGEAKSETVERFDKLEEQLAATGTHTKSEAAAAVKPLRDVFNTFAKKFGKDVEDLFRDVRVMVDDGTGELLLKQKKAFGSELLSAELFDNAGLAPAERAKRLYEDPISGLRTVRAWNETSRRPGEQIAVITSPDVKAINDHIEGGHDSANDLLRAIGAAVGKHDPEAARGGTNFLFHVRGSAHLAQVLADVKKALPDAKLGIEGAMGATLEEARAKLDTSVDAKRAAKTLPARGSTNFDLSKLTKTEFSKERAKPNLPAELVAKAGALSKAEFFKQAYQDAEVPGVLSAIGWHHLPRKAHVASIDIKGLKDINALGKEVGDRVLKLFAQVAEHNDASDFDFAHLSGDEYAAQHDDPVKLQAWLDHVRAELVKDRIPVTIEEEGVATKVIAARAEFRSGIGEKTYGNADRALNAGKVEEKRRAAGGVDSGTAGSVREGSPQGEAQPYERRGAPEQGFVDRAAPGTEEVAAARLTQPDGGSGEANGFTDIAREGINRVFRIGLNPGSNKSTFLHESGHVFLELFGDLANRADAPESVRADWAATLKWLGVGSQLEIKTEQHEKWARAFEVYLGEGKAPTGKLEGPFQRFKLWMNAVYKKLSTLGEVNPEIRGVFDRLLATDKEIEATKERMGLRALPRETLGMTGEEYQAHLDKLAQASAHALQAADFQVAKDKLRETEAFWKEEKAKRKAQADDEFEAFPARRAQLILQGKPAGDFLGMKEPMSRAVVESMVGKKAGRKFHLAAVGLHPDEVAELLGFGTGKGLLDAVLQLPEKDSWVEQRAEQQMHEDYPGVLDERTELRTLVAGGLHGSATKEWVLKEWQALKSRGTKTAPHMPPVEVIKRAAEIMAAGRAVGKLGTRDALVDERTAANNAAKAAVLGNYELAAVYKQQQLLNMYLYDSLQKAKKESEQFLKLADKLSQTKARQRLGKASPVYRDAVDLLLSTFNLAEADPALTKSLGEVLADVEQLMNEDQTSVGFDRDRVIDRAGDWKKLAVEDMRQVFKALQNISTAANNRATVVLDEKRAEKEFVIDGLEREAELLEKRPEEPTKEAETFLQGLGRRWTSYDGSLLKIETMARWLGGGKNTADFIKSFWFRSIIKPMQDAKTKETDLYREHVQPIVEAFDAIPKESQARQMEKIDGRALFPNHIAEKLPTRRFEILMMLLNAGNESNLARLTEGRNITEQQLRDAALKVGVTKEEYAWLQAIGDASEGLKPLAFDLEEKDSGLRPEAIAPRPFATPFGMMPGFYFPAVYDRDVTTVGKKQEVTSLADFQDQSFTRIGTSNSSLKSRVNGFTDVISLSPGSINRHFAQTVHDIAFREAVKSVGTLLLNERVQDVLRQRLGTGRGDQFVQWAKDVASMRGVEGSVHTQEIVNWARALRSNVVTAVLGFKLPNAAEDFTSNLVSAIAATDLKTKHLAGAYAEFGASPRETRAIVLAKSGELRTRKGQVQRDLAKQLKALTTTKAGRIFTKGPIGFYKDHAFAFAEAVEVATATPIWLGAYRQALSQAQSEADAVTFADATLRQALVSHNTVDLSGLMRDKGFVGYLTMFMGAFNHFYNQGRDAGHQWAVSDDAKTKARIAGAALGLAVGYFVVGSLARGQGPGRDEDKSEWLFRKLMLEGVLQTMPIVNVAASVVATHLQDKKVQARNNSLYGMAESITDSLFTILDSEKDTDKRVKAFFNTLGPLSGLPTAAVLQTGGPILDWAFDENEWRNPFDAASDVTYGKKADNPWNPLQAAGDAISGGQRQ